jgi:seryl-tRNA synthetase
MTEKLKARIAQLELELTKAINDYRTLERERSETVASVNKSMHQALEREKETRAQFVDLKERLANAESENQRMRGYLARVQEDDVVREELVPVGDPGGEQQLVPKRKPTIFHGQNPYQSAQCNSVGDAVDYLRGGEKRRPRHWVTY